MEGANMLETAKNESNEVNIIEGEEIVDEAEQPIHIPYILNGELYEIKTQDGENVTVKCCHCPVDRVYRGSVRSTGNFHMHIKRRHPDLLAKLHNMKVNALLERRDRLIKNRNNNFKNRHSSSGNARNSNLKGKRNISDTGTETIPMQTHNLKIKTAFQRHQKQAQEAMRNDVQLNTTYSSDEEKAPLDLSTRSATTSVKQMQPVNIAYVPFSPQYNSLSSEPAAMDGSSENGEMEAVNCNEIALSPTVVCTNDLNSRNLDQLTTFVKDEEVSGNQIIDLSTSSQTDGNIGITTLTSPAGAACNQAQYPNSICNLKCHEMFQHIETSLRNIQHELRARNQVEMNRIFLDIAKFKFLYPGFNFNF